MLSLIASIRAMARALDLQAQALEIQCVGYQELFKERTGVDGPEPAPANAEIAQFLPPNSGEQGGAQGEAQGEARSGQETALNAPSGDSVLEPCPVGCKAKYRAPARNTAHPGWTKCRMCGKEHSDGRENV